MFNQQEFEEKVYWLVTDEVNHVFAELIASGDKDRLNGEAIRINRQIMQGLHYVVEEIVTQNLCGLLVNHDIVRE